YLEFGGNSLTAIKLISTIYKKFGAELNIRDLFENGSVESIAEIIEKSREVRLESYPRAASKEFDLLSSQQKRVWIESQLDAESIAYNIPSAYMLEGALDVDLLERALNIIINRYEILRTAFVETDGEPRQAVNEKAYLKINRYKSDNPDEIINKLAKKAFDLARAPLIDCSVIETGERRYVLLFNIHHLITDGWSLRLMVKELNYIYKALKAEEPLALEEPEIQYRDYVYNQTLSLDGAEMEESRKYWLEKLSGEIEPLNIPTDYDRPMERKFTGSTYRKLLSTDAAEALDFLSEKFKATKFALTTSLLNTLLAYYSGQKDIIIGTVASGRAHSSLQTQQGFFSNTIALRNEVKADAPFAELTEQVKSCIVESMKQQEYPFEKLLEELHLEKDPGRNPLFDIMFIYRDREAESLALDGVKAEEITLEETVSRLDMGIEFVEKPVGYSLEINYNDALYKRKTIESFTDHFERLILSVFSNPDRRVGEYEILSDAEIHRLLNLNYNKVDYDIQTPIHAQFSEIARRNPESIAIVHRKKAVTYGELDRKSDDIAAYLTTACNVGKGDVVATLIDRGVDLIAALLGILKASAVYMPLDAEYPAERISMMLEACKCKLILGAGAEITGAPVVDIKSVPRAENYRAEELDTRAAAYIIFTSGTTGAPKGATISHRGFLNSILGQIEHYKYCEKDSALQFASQTFDGSLTEIFLALLSGASLVIADREIIGDTSVFTQYLSENKVNRAYIPPSYLSLLDKSALNLQTILSAGESPASRELAELAERADVYNVYGPTEASCTASFYRVSHADAERRRIPIGKPIANTNLLIMNPSMKLMPHGFAGEICIAGEGVGLGYINNSSDEVFGHNPYSPGQRIYKSGDLGRLTEDGNIEFLGRCDNQVKINGYRIEPEEIEIAANASKRVMQAAVALVGCENERRELAAFVVLKDGESALEFETELKSMLPRYLLPSRFEYRDSLPLTPNGKTDKRKLVAECKLHADKPNNQKSAPHTETQKRLADLIKDILKIDSVYLEDNFFKIGGHSLAAIQLLSRINREFNRSLAIGEIFSAASIADLAARITNASLSGETEIPCAPKSEYYELSHAQKRIYVVSQMEKESLAYNSPSVYRLKGRFKPDVFEKAVNVLVNRHDSFRTSFRETERGVKQYVLESLIFTIPILDFRGIPEAEKAINADIEAEAAKPFELSAAPLMRIKLYKFADEDYFLYINIHHIIADGWSIDIVARELNAIYNALERGNEYTERVPELQYKDFALWQSKKIAEGELDSQKKYWLEKLSGELAALDLPIKNARPLFKTYRGKTFKQSVSQDTYRAFEKFTRDGSTSMFAFFTAALKSLLHRYTNQEDIIIGGAVAGRGNRSLDGTVGLFSNTVALRDQIKSDDTFEDVLYKVKNTIQESLENQDYPFDLLVEDLDLPRSTERGALFDIAIVYQNSDASTLSLTGVDSAPYAIENGISKFEMLFSFIEENGGLSLEINYNSDIYSEEFISRIPGHLFLFAEQAVKGAESKQKNIGRYRALTESEIGEYERFNNTEYPRFAKASIPDLFRKIALANPANTAIESDRFKCDYERLNRITDSIAQFIINKGISKGDVVALQTRRDEKYILCMLGIMKSGAVYLPIDEKTPADRVRYILSNASAKLLIAGDSQKAEEAGAAEVVLIEEIPGDLTLINSPAISPDDISYIIYTSGTTGEPKGILVSNVNLVNTILHQIDEFKLDGSSAVMQFYSPSFDASMLEAFCALFSGAKLVLVDDELKNTPAEFLDFINKHGVTLAFFPPSFLSVLDKSKLSGLKTILTGMEPPIPGDAIELSGHLDYYNIYGPTETTVICAFHKFDPSADAGGAIPIGKPMRNYKIYICNDYLEPQPRNIVGEICIEGMGVTCGYIGDERLTNEKYVELPFSGNRVFRSGDLGRINDNGDIVFVGRKDKQVKIRGFRVELGEIKISLENIPGIREAYVAIAAKEEGNNELVAYYSTLRKIEPMDIARRLRQKLPEYMIPGHIIPIDSIPTTNNGKVDASQLPDPFEFSASAEGIKEASTEMESRLAKLWSDALNCKNVGVNQNFFMLGGDSIKAIRLIALAKQNGLDFDVKSIFLYPTVEELAPHVKQKASTIDQGVVTGTFPLTGIQRWFFENQGNSVRHFNQAFLLKSKGKLDYDYIRTAFEEITLRHDALRMVFNEKDGEIIQENRGAELKPEVSYIDLSRGGGDVQSEIRTIAERMQCSMDIENGPLIKAALLHCGEIDRLLIIIHHLVVDGVSWRIILEDLSSAYENLAKNETIKLPAKTDSFGKWSLALRDYLRSDTFAHALDYWKRQDFTGAERVQSEARFEKNTFEYNEIASFSLTARQTRDLLQNSTGINEIALSALGVAFNKTFGVERLAVLLEGHGREEVVKNIDVSRTVGWFTSFYPILLNASNGGAPIEVLGKTKKLLAAVPNNGFDYVLIKYLLGEENAISSYAPQVSFNYLGQFKSDIDGGIFAGSEEHTGASVSANAERIQDFIINAIVESDKFELFLSYNKMRFAGATIQKLLENYGTALVELIELSVNGGRDAITASDLDADVFGDDAALDEFLDSL
ncbi:MAG: amino acid adenylation domain-containing protein, partial [Chloroflexota bacterium]